MILYINACPRIGSRTNRLAKALLDKLGVYTELKLETLGLEPLDHGRLEERTALIDQKAYDHEMFNLAKEFANADTIVMAAPYWDGSFPSILKMYIENIYVTGIVSEYGENGMPRGLCKAKKLYYVTTAGGPYNPAFSYEYIKELAIHMFGIEETELVYAENLDIIGNDPEKILEDAILAL